MLRSHGLAVPDPPARPDLRLRKCRSVLESFKKQGSFCATENLAGESCLRCTHVKDPDGSADASLALIFLEAADPENCSHIH